MKDPRLQEPAEGDDTVISTALIASLVVFAVLGVGGYVAYRVLTRTETVEIAEPEAPVLPKSRELPQVEPPEVIWTDITQSSGIDFVHESGAAGEKLLPETMGGGCAFFDYDGDGDSDLLFVNSRQWPWNSETAGPPATLALYENDGTGQFRDVTEAAGLNISVYGMGAACGDYDNDGRVDLFISCLGQDRLFHNDGGRFTDVTEAAGVGGDENAWSVSTGWFDYDRDGDLDLFVTHYVEWSRDYDTAQNFRLLGGGERAYGRPQAFGGTFPSLFRNDGGGAFTDVSEAAGLHVRNPATETPMAKSLGLTFEDFNDDGYLDVLVSNDTVQNFLFSNRRDGTFEEVGALAGIAFDNDGQARGAMGVDASQFRNDRSLGIAIGNFSNEMTALYVTRQRNLQFYDEAVVNGLGPATRLELSFGVLFLDYDLDGRMDLFQANGHLEEDIQKVQRSQHYEQPPQLFWNAGPEYNTEFVPCDWKKTGPDLQQPMVGRGAAYADIDGDGDLDILVVGGGSRPRLLRNDQALGRHWLRVKLVGKSVNRDAIGARVNLQAGDRTQTRLVSPTRSYLSQVELPVTFGLGETAEIDALTIIWPDGSEQPVADVQPDQTLVVEQQ